MLASVWAYWCSGNALEIIAGYWVRVSVVAPVIIDWFRVVFVIVSRQVPGQCRRQATTTLVFILCTTSFTNRASYFSMSY